MKLNIHEVDHHRNGVVGEPFHVVRFTDTSQPELGEFVAVVFDHFDADDYGPAYDDPDEMAKQRRASRECRTAVLNVGMLTDPNAKLKVRFGVNSWRGDRYDDALREAITAWYRREVKTVVTQ